MKSSINNVKSLDNSTQSRKRNREISLENIIENSEFTKFHFDSEDEDFHKIPNSIVAIESYPIINGEKKIEFGNGFF